MPDTNLTVHLRHHIGSLALEAAFTLRHPWTVLFGPSGAGKSTLLRILAGTIKPDYAQLQLGEKTLIDTEAGVFVPPGRREIGFLTQSLSLFPHLNVRANVAFGLHHLPKAEQDQRTKAMLQLFNAEALSGQKPPTLSGGERQRVALARALAPQPKFLLLDEPFAALDSRLKEAILADLVPWLRERSIPVLYVSHDLTEALQTGSEVIHLDGGRVTAQGPAIEVLAEQRRKLLRLLGDPAS